jgi:hypothetical protein
MHLNVVFYLRKNLLLNDLAKNDEGVQLVDDYWQQQTFKLLSS